MAFKKQFTIGLGGKVSQIRKNYPFFFKFVRSFPTRRCEPQHNSFEKLKRSKSRRKI